MPPPKKTTPDPIRRESWREADHIVQGQVHALIAQHDYAHAVQRALAAGFRIDVADLSLHVHARIKDMSPGAAAHLKMENAGEWLDERQALLLIENSRRLPWMATTKAEERAAERAANDKAKREQDAAIERRIAERRAERESQATAEDRRLAMLDRARAADDIARGVRRAS